MVAKTSAVVELLSIAIWPMFGASVSANFTIPRGIPIAMSKSQPPIPRGVGGACPSSAGSASARCPVVFSRSGKGVPHRAQIPAASSFSAPHPLQCLIRAASHAAGDTRYPQSVWKKLKTRLPRLCSFPNVYFNLPTNGSLTPLFDETSAVSMMAMTRRDSSGFTSSSAPSRMCAAMFS